tara:strand:+ start:856 stop:1329 length:474 start_codon:yes stop_codon:yes gene_type:complete
MKKYNISKELKQLLIEALKDLEDKIGRKAYYNDLKDPELARDISLTPDEFETVIARSGAQRHPTRPLRGPFSEPNRGNNNKTVAMRPQDDTEADGDATTIPDDTKVDSAFSTTDVVSRIANELADELAKKINAAEPMDQKDLSAAIEAEIKNYLSNR